MDLNHILESDEFVTVFRTTVTGEKFVERWQAVPDTGLPDYSSSSNMVHACKLLGYDGRMEYSKQFHEETMSEIAKRTRNIIEAIKSA